MQLCTPKMRFEPKSGPRDDQNQKYHHLKKEIDIAMAQIMGSGPEHGHEHSHEHGDECCANPDCENKKEEE